MVYFGTQFTDMVYHGEKGMAAGVWDSWSHGTHVRKQREMDADAQLALSFLFSPGPQPRDGSSDLS